MFKKLISLVLVAASFLLLGGCANQPRLQNAAVGAGLGGVAGALLGDSGKAARIGAGLGLLTGLVVPVNDQPHYGQPIYGHPNVNPGNYPPPPPGVSCQPGSVWDGRGCLRVGSGVPYPGTQPIYGHPNVNSGNYPPPPPGVSCQPGSVWDGRDCLNVGGQQQHPGFWPQQNPAVQQGAVCGEAIRHMTCPSIRVGNGCRRCQ